MEIREIRLAVVRGSIRMRRVGWDGRQELYNAGDAQDMSARCRNQRMSYDVSADALWAAETMLCNALLSTQGRQAQRLVLMPVIPTCSEFYHICRKALARGRAQPMAVILCHPTPDSRESLT